MLKTTLGGRYSIISRLGVGGFGETYLAEDMQLPDHHCCVVKHLKPKAIEQEILDIARRLFDSEAKVLHRLGSHDRIPRLLASFEEDQEFYLVQELIEGHGLDKELTLGKKWSEAQVINLLQDILETLEFVHQQKVIHRDIKPENLMRRTQDGKLILIDFGAVKQVCTQVITNSKRAKSTITIGTLGYMPSEQSSGYPQINSDIYALGIICIQALTGLDPDFIPKNPHTLELEWSHLGCFSADLIEIINKMVRYDFRQRYPSATAVLKDLESVEILPQSIQQDIPPNLMPLTDQNLDTAIELSPSFPSTQLDIAQLNVPNRKLPELNSLEPTIIEPTSNKPESQIFLFLPKVLIGTAIATLIIISGIAINQIVQVKSVVSTSVPVTSELATSEPSIPQQTEEEKAELILRHGEVLDQVLTGIKSGDKLQDIQTLAATIPETSPLRNKVDMALVNYKKQWEQDKQAFNEVNTAYRAKNWKSALNSYKKILTPYWRQESKWIADQANTEVAAAIAPKPILPRIVPRTEETPNNTYTAPTKYEPPAQPQIIPRPNREPASGKFSIPEAQ